MTMKGGGKGSASSPWGPTPVSADQLVVDEGTSFLRHRLRRLRLENNKLTSLPVELGALPNLTEVCLEGNHLAEALTDYDPTISKMRATCDKHQG